MKRILRSQGLRPFAVPGYWRLWITGITSSLSFTTTTLGVGWLVLEITGSVGLLGLTALVSGLTVISFTPFSSTLVDKYNRRNLLVGAQILQGSGFLILGAITFIAGFIEYWHLLVASIAWGIARSAMMPARNALTFDIVGRGNILNAETLNFLAINISQLLGPIAAGFILDIWGPGPFFIVMGITYLAGTAILLGVSVPRVSTRTTQLGWRALSAGFSFAFQDRETRTVVWVVLVTELLGFAVLALLPAANRELLNGDARMLGLLSGTFGLGGLTATLTITAIGGVRSRAWVLMGASAMMGVSIIAFSQSDTFLLSLPFIFLAGVSGTTYDVMNGTLFQTLTPEHIRGRVLGVRSMLMSGSQVGSGVIGGSAERLGLSLALLIAGTSIAVNALRVIPAARTINMRSNLDLSEGIPSGQLSHDHITSD